MRRLFSFNYNLCNSFLNSKIIMVKTNESCTWYDFFRLYSVIISSYQKNYTHIPNSYGFYQISSKWHKIVYLKSMWSVKKNSICVPEFLKNRQPWIAFKGEKTNGFAFLVITLPNVGKWTGWPRSEEHCSCMVITYLSGYYGFT